MKGLPTNRELATLLYPAPFFADVGSEPNGVELSHRESTHTCHSEFRKRDWTFLLDLLELKDSRVHNKLVKARARDHSFLPNIHDA